jgi:hypothetical protein
MKVGYLKEVLASFDDDKELAILATFPNLTNWSVSTYDMAIGIDEETKSPQLEISIYLADFDYPQILRELKDIVAAIPEENCAKG